MKPRKKRESAAFNPIDIHVGKRVRIRRKLLGMGQTVLGDSIGLTFQQVQKYENGTNRIGASNLYKASQALGVKVAYFFKGVEAAVKFYASPQAEIPEKDPMTDTESVRLAHDYFRIRDEGVRKQFGLLVKALARAEE